MAERRQDGRLIGHAAADSSFFVYEREFSQVSVFYHDIYFSTFWRKDGSKNNDHLSESRKTLTGPVVSGNFQ